MATDTTDIYLAFYASLVTRCILILGCICVLVHVHRGSNYKAVIFLTWLLLINSLTGFSAAVALLKIQLDVLPADGTTDLFWVWLFASTLGIRDITFCVSHQLLAMRYWKVAKEIPLTLERDERDDSETES